MPRATVPLSFNVCVSLMSLLESVGQNAWALLPIALAAVLWILALFSATVSNVVYKLHLASLGARHLLFSRDKKWKKQPDPDAAVPADTPLEKKVIFIRHGESEWNLVFNKGFGPSFFIRLITALIREFLMVTTLDSIFFDSPLSAEGITQAKELYDFVERESNVLHGGSSSSKRS